MTLLGDAPLRRLRFAAVAVTPLPTLCIPTRLSGPHSRVAMRAEIERLVEEIKQSVGLLRRHL
jgi:hypothetical protein